MKETNQFGRSMLEMLGVLAIIGILSIGGIYTYKYAISKNKANAIMQAVSNANTDMQIGIEPDDPPKISGVILSYVGEYKGTPYGVIAEIDDKRTCQLFKDLAADTGWIVEGECTE